jgi:general L-amino acid transport system permease protein
MASRSTAARPPEAKQGLIARLRNLFSSPLNTLLTILASWIVYQVVTAAVRWAFIDATWEGPDGAACTHEGAGACWPFVVDWFGQFMYGRYPESERPRVNLTYVLALAGLLPLMIPCFRCWRPFCSPAACSASSTFRPTSGAGCW